jgi:hypothetical protein
MGRRRGRKIANPLADVDTGRTVVESECVETRRFEGNRRLYSNALLCRQNVESTSTFNRKR